MNNGDAILKSRKSNGFTMIEVLIVVVIVGIIASVAIPSYMSNVQSTKRTDGRVALMDIMQAQERHFAENLTYSADLTDLGYGTSTSVSSHGGHYAITATAGCVAGGNALTIANCVLLTATGDASTDGDITLDSLGNKLPADKW